jgi:hypothetical protein
MEDLATSSFVQQATLVLELRGNEINSAGGLKRFKLESLQIQLDLMS